MTSSTPIQAISRIRNGSPITRDDFLALEVAGYLTCSGQDRDRILALFDAGWEPGYAAVVFTDAVYTWPMSWPWRRPPRRPGTPGRRYASTTQAYNAMVRERGAGPA